MPDPPKQPKHVVGEPPEVYDSLAAAQDAKRDADARLAAALVVKDEPRAFVPIRWALRYSDDQPRDEQGRWTSDGGGIDVSGGDSGGGGGGGSPDAGGGGGAAATPGGYRQPFTNQQDLYAAARADDPQFQHIVDDAVAASEPDDKAVHADLKGEDRAVEKVNGKYGGDWSRLNDVSRATIVVPNNAAVPEAMAAAEQEAQQDGWKPVDVENRFDSGPTSAGYRDASMHLVGPDGFASELQINTQAMMDVKDGEGHALYEQIRPLTERVNAGGPPLSAAEQATVTAAMSKMNSLYGAAYAAGQ